MLLFLVEIRRSCIRHEGQLRCFGFQFEFGGKQNVPINTMCR
jgi:hypothetical protein